MVDMYIFPGPALGSFLYSIGGFTLPFLVVGSVGLVVATFLVFVIPNVKPDPVKKPSETALTFKQIAMVSHSPLGDFRKFTLDTYFCTFQSPSIFMPYVDLLVCFFGNGMITSMLEPHLKEAGANTNQVGITFLIFGAVYMACTPCVGFVSVEIIVRARERSARPRTLTILHNTYI